MIQTGCAKDRKPTKQDVLVQTTFGFQWMAAQWSPVKVCHYNKPTLVLSYTKSSLCLATQSNYDYLAFAHWHSLAKGNLKIVVIKVAGKTQLIRFPGIYSVILGRWVDLVESGSDITTCKANTSFPNGLNDNLHATLTWVRS